ncbi:MAG: NTP transferase domain-containing protein [Nitrososphaerota archaeon]
MALLIIMAGGLGKRLGVGVEKPLVMLGGKRLIDYVIDAALEAETIRKIICITSQNTPDTTKYLLSRGFEVIKGKGTGYYDDLLSALWGLPSDIYVICSADIPFILSKDIDQLVKEYAEGLCGNPYILVAVPVEIVKKLGLSASSRFKVDEQELCPAGLRLIDKRLIAERRLPKPYILVLNEPRLGVNINTIDDLKLAEALLRGNLSRLL